MHFPQDHGPHTKTEVEWWYAWGKLENIWFHWALFKKGKKMVLHGSIHRKGKIKFFEHIIKKLSDGFFAKGNTILLKSPKFILECVIRSDPVEYRGHERFYYSIPHLIIRGKLKTGLRTIAVQGNGWFDHEWGKKPKHNWQWTALKFDDGQVEMTYKKYRSLPQRNEKVFKPKFGWPYSEQPLLIMKDDKPIGFGMRERTYRRF